MELFMNLMYILVTSVLVENVVLAKFLGCCPFLGVSKKLDSAVGMSSAVIFVMLMATAVTWPIYTYLLAPQGLDYLQTIVFILVIAALVLFAGVRSKMETVEFPKSFQGIPITLIAASIVSMSFMGFASVADGIFK